MARTKPTYNLPDYRTTTDDLDTHVKAWQQMASPIEEALKLKLIGYDPDFLFCSENPQRSGVSMITLPVWFVKRLNEQLVVSA